jgi:predicted dithiol-disulfide oxidoreductase (DUF899 family)
VKSYQVTDSADYAAAREELRRAEIALIRQREEVAALRRSLPLEAGIEDYVFYEGPAQLGGGDDPVRPVRLSELFTSPERPLIVYHLMYGKSQTSPCPMCTMWIDGFNALAEHLAQNADLVIVAAADVAPLRGHARDRGWDRLRLLSCGDNTFKRDLGSEDADGTQDSTISVFTLDAAGSPCHAYTARPSMGDGINERGLDLLSPVWASSTSRRRGGATGTPSSTTASEGPGPA